MTHGRKNRHRGDSSQFLTSEYISLQILRRISDIDLVTAQALYHKKCYLDIVKGKQSLKRGRPDCTDVLSAMQIVYDYIEKNEDSQFSIRELRDILSDYIPDDRTIIKKLSEKYGQRLFLTEVPGCSPIVTLKDSVDNILKDVWYSQKNNDERTERIRIVKKAAEIIREDIRLKTYEKDSYPSPNNFLKNSVQDVPESLNIFLKTLAGQNSVNEEVDRKLISIAHAIISVLRPRKFVSCILLALAITMKKNFGSKALLTLLNKLGFCASYSEANLFEISAINVDETWQQQKGFRQFVFDNADANIATLDGKNTFHAMGGIECTTPMPMHLFEHDVPKIGRELSADILGTFGNVPLQYCNKKKNGLHNLTVENISTEQKIIPSISDIMWLYGKHYDIPNIPGWSGFMQNLTKRESFEVTHVKALPFVNAPPSNLDTINTVLIMAAQKTIQNGQTTTLVTFDQPLYAKARDIVAEASERQEPLLSSIIVRLGGFHLLMSFMGGIGYIMAGSGLKELWSTIFAPNSVIHMLGGHAYSRALRAHFLTYLALADYIVKEITLTDNELLEVKMTLHCINDGVTTDDLKEELFNTIKNKFDDAMCKLENKSPTAKLWMQYFKMVCLIKRFIEAERSGNWQLHLDTAKQMLPIFVASGHFNYAKSLRVYIQDMDKLEQVMSPEEYNNFTSGAFTIRRNEKFWSGTWTDMVIEQSLMRTMKCAGGLTHGRGFTDNILAKWILSMPLVQKVEDCLDSFCDLDDNIDTMHKDSTNARMKRDGQDLTKLKEWFEDHPPFTHEGENSIVSLSTGLVGDTKDINCHKAFEIGQAVLTKKSGIPFSDLTYSRKERVVTLLAVNAAIKSSDHNVISIDPLTIFQRISFLKKTEEEMKDYLTHELAPFPMALFDEHGMRKTKKAALYDLYKPVDDSLTGVQIHYVIDGGHLLHRVVWNKGQTFEDICFNIAEYVKRHYGTDVTTVFDGYEESTLTTCTKTAERMRRSGYKNTAEVLVAPNMPITTSQEEFLKSNTNKLRFIGLLKDYLEQNNIKVKQCDADADVYIVREALREASSNRIVVIIGNDIDLLLLLSAMAQDEQKNVFLLKPAQGKQEARLYNTDSLTVKNLKDHILTLHAFGGCDTTSAVFNLGKKKYFQITKNSDELKEKLNVFRERNVSQDVISRAGEQLFLALYGGDLNGNLNELRYQKFARSITKSKINLANLPPTKSAAQQHALRVYHQVQMWLGNSLDPKEYGWMEENRILKPVMMTIKAAPENVLNMIYCRCKTNCGSKCGCRKSGLNCTDICENCKGQSCSNGLLLLHESEENEELMQDVSVVNISPCNASQNKRRRI